jgi:hypothetical protein
MFPHGTPCLFTMPYTKFYADKSTTLLFKQIPQCKGTHKHGVSNQLKKILDYLPRHAFS